MNELFGRMHHTYFQERLKLFHEDASGARKEIKLARFDLIPPDFLQALAEHYGNGAAKYEDRNWEQGYPYSLSYAALQRHVTAWWNGEDNDGEEGFGQSHLIAAAWHCIALWWFHEHEKGTDDRPGNSSTRHHNGEAQQLLPTPPDSVIERLRSNSKHPAFGADRASYDSTQHSEVAGWHTPRPGIVITAPWKVGEKWFIRVKIKGKPDHILFGNSSILAQLAASKYVENYENSRY